MKAHKQEVPTPPVEKVYEVVLTMTPQEARLLSHYLAEGGKDGVAWDLGGDPRRDAYYTITDALESR